MLMFIFLVLAQLTVFTGAQLGVNYGLLGDNLPPPGFVVNLIKSKNIPSVRIFDPNPLVLDALRYSNLTVTMGVRNEDLANLAVNRQASDDWIQTNYIPYYKDVSFKYLSVGNEVIPGPLAAYVLPAMQNLFTSLQAANLEGAVLITTTVSTQVIGVSYPPSQGAFSEEVAIVMSDIMQFLHITSTPLLVNIYPYFALASNPTTISLEYALGISKTPAVEDQCLQYYSLYHAMLDAFVAALARVIPEEDVKIVVAETGWPSAGELPYATLDNARIYNNNLKYAMAAGTPRRPFVQVETFIFALFNENLKSAGVEQNFGSFYPSMDPVYPLDFI